ncbi:MAG: flavodoxin-dependent (E)-4-hydroxy-3-methylbut-2-enyl-diphosphate synthase [Lachnospiraceae bacterium]|nr:flavodoxin-dependent (E)-4-hydroxy-3-methylbut-2-enyl-diphosphate synthase [Lachnospiraceae bacterium]
MERRKTRLVRIGDVEIGGGLPIRIQSMTNTKTKDVDATVDQILSLEQAGCELIRSTVNNEEAAEAFGEIKKRIHIPLIADIHFDYRLAISAIENGADKIRINPGNIGEKSRVAEVVRAAKERNVPIRVGVNAGSLEKELRMKEGGATPKALVESCLRNAALIEDLGYDNLVLSIKASDVEVAEEAHLSLSERTDHPLHVGITEAGTALYGSVKSAIGLTKILSKGIGDTIRVSLSADPVLEIRVARQILRTLGLRKDGVEVVSCPTCGRTEIDLIPLAEEVTRRTEDLPLQLKVAVMGCVVNGPGEAKDADLAICGGKGVGLLLKKGEILRKVPEESLVEELMGELKNYL